MTRLPHITIFFAAVLLVAADKKPEKAKEPAPSPAKIQQWIKQLGDDDFHVREEATQNLLIVGKVAIEAVSEATKNEDEEVKQRALKILKQFDKPITYFKELGGNVTVYEKSPGRPVIGLFLIGAEVTDAKLVHLKGLTKLQWLILPRTKITGAGLVHLKGLTSLRILSLWETEVTDAGLVHLKGLTELQKLYLNDTEVTDAGLVHLKGLTNLQELNLNGTKATQAEIEKLRKALPDCKIIWDGK